MARCVDCIHCRTKVVPKNNGILRSFWCRFKHFTPIGYVTQQIGTPRSLFIGHQCPDFDGDEVITVPGCHDPSILQIGAYNAF